MTSLVEVNNPIDYANRSNVAVVWIAMIVQVEAGAPGLHEANSHLPFAARTAASEFASCVRLCDWRAQGAVRWPINWLLQKSKGET